MKGAEYAVVIPTVGRPCLRDCLAALASTAGPAPSDVVVVDDRPGAAGEVPLDGAGSLPVRRVVSGGHGPAAARNAGFRAVSAPWVVFLDDDVRVTADWGERLAADLASAEPGVGGVQGRLVVPLPEDRKPTDWERGTAGLQDAAWATADMAYRRDVLEKAGGFDPRFPRAFREDADLALRVMAAGWRLCRGERVTHHPVRPTDRWVSVRAQRGNADDVLMTKVHGRDWWARAQAPRGRLPRHLAVTGAGLAAVVLALAGQRRPAAAAAGLWALGTAEFAVARIAPGPRTADEVATMVATSVVIPPFAVRHWLGGLIAHRGTVR
ncbi:glycosyltransferase family 2 protein [Streptomyces montanisoli]|uniref:Glycosyltransferase n=1 Tax=Streptomyces montanisoli TaxID=2798581 RepID=A0A940MHY1_9ACTN|nr:glycosyltransferase [Streptomyces montanisoli]MBP0459556.1 glycosyltransferase [Streptomyces montanisoli]